MKSDDSPWGPLWAVCLRVRTHIGQYHGPAAIVVSKMNNKLARLLLLFIPFFGSFQVSSGVVLSTAPIFGFSSRRPRQEERMICTVRTVQYRIHNFWTNFQLTFAVHWQVTKKKKKKMGQKTGAENWGRKLGLKTQDSLWARGTKFISPLQKRCMFSKRRNGKYNTGTF